MKIDRIRVYAAVATGDWHRTVVTQTILRITTADGLEGLAGATTYTPNARDGSVAEGLRCTLPVLFRHSPFDREAIRRELEAATITIPTPLGAISLIDIALHDLAAKAAGLPLYRFLGAARERIPSYASLRRLDDAQAYVDAVAGHIAEGYKAFKLHVWCDLARDLAAIAALDKRYGGKGYDFLYDPDMGYTRAQALRIGQALDEAQYGWFEAPLFDHDIDGYRELKRRLSTPILCSGNQILDPLMLAQMIKLDCWSHLRVDATFAGGISGARRIAALAEANGMNLELQSWGYPLTQAANLHVMLSIPNSTYFEQAVPVEHLEWASQDFIRTGPDGCVRAPEGPGLGIRPDWPAIEKASFASYELRP